MCIGTEKDEIKNAKQKHGQEEKPLKIKRDFKMYMDKTLINREK